MLVAFLPTRQPIVTWPSEEPLASLWEEPVDPASANLFDGPWGHDQAPDPDATFTFLRPKPNGVTPGVIVRDPSGREWHVKQAAREGVDADGPAEVVVSRVLSAVGYHQPPVYFLPSFRMTTGVAAAAAARTNAGGRFRPHIAPLIDLGSWSWQQNPFVGTQPYQALLVILRLFNSTDLKDSNNALYRVSIDDQVEHWYVVRDLAAALGDSGRATPRAVAAERYEQSRFIAGVRNGFVEFANRSPVSGSLSTSHHSRRRATGRRPAGPPHGSPVARRLPRRRLPARGCRPIYSEDPPEHRGSPTHRRYLGIVRPALRRHRIR